MNFVIEDIIALKELAMYQQITSDMLKTDNKDTTSNVMEKDVFVSDDDNNSSSDDESPF